MSDIKLFQIANSEVRELKGQSMALEKSLQTLMEEQLEVFLGVRFLASEYSTGKTHRGRIDTLGLDENGCPVIIEYKRSSNENVINQGLYYLDWLFDHQAEFELLVLRKYGQEAADSIEWNSPRLLCIAGNFTKFDEHAVQQINRNIELYRYLKFGEELFLLELLNAVQADDSDNNIPRSYKISVRTGSSHKAEEYDLGNASQGLLDLYDALKTMLLSFGDDVQIKSVKNYIAFKRIKNFACVVLRAAQNKILIYVKVDPDSIELSDITRDVRNIGHIAPGDLEITLRNIEDLRKAQPLFEISYEES
ncbi:Endonuclease NucS [Planctomycetales bacterium 10988]|nr:Endonuclease NucS [Planctomycetales bacterium 10988]